MKNAALSVLAIAGLLYSVKLAYEIDNSNFSRQNRNRYVGIEFDTNTSQVSIAKKQELPDPFTLNASKPPSSPPPSTIIVGPFLYTISYRDKSTMPNYYGETWQWTHTILLRADLPHDQLKETLLHELFHACIGIGNGGERSFAADDGFIEATAPTMLLIMRDNPKLMKWLAEIPEGE